MTHPICQELYRLSPVYRHLVDEAYRLEQAYGALRAAYGNAINDQERLKDELRRAGGQWSDDPGRGGSGGM